jgi:hypothetical protein
MKIGFQSKTIPTGTPGNFIISKINKGAYCEAL